MTQNITLHIDDPIQIRSIISYNILSNCFIVINRETAIMLQ